MNLGAQPYVFHNARKLRRKRTEAEMVLWEKLRDRQLLNVKFRQQHPILNYIVDFYAHEYHYAIEVDGSIHLTKHKRLNDEERFTQLKRKGVYLDRFTNDEILMNVDSVLEKIESRIKVFRVMKGN